MSSKTRASAQLFGSLRTARLLAAYGAGIQVHVEDLLAHLAGRDRCDAAARFEELFPAYQELAAGVGE
jgi:hypothetical protein